MYIIRNVNNGDCFVGMVYHGECGWHAGFSWKFQLDDDEIIQYSTKVQAEQQMKFLEEMFHEKHLEVVEV
jgi:hypothetical protein